MNTVLDADTLVRAALWLLALALPLAMLLWMAAQFVAMRSLGRRVRALEAAAGRASDGAPPDGADRPSPAAAPTTPPDPVTAAPAGGQAAPAGDRPASDGDEGTEEAAS